MSWTDERFFDSVVQTTGQGTDWLNLQNVLSDEFSFAETSGQVGGTSFSEVISFTTTIGSIIPPGSTINKVRIKYKASYDVSAAARYYQMLRYFTGTTLDVQADSETWGRDGDHQSNETLTFERTLTEWGMSQADMLEVLNGNQPFVMRAEPANGSLRARILFARIAVDFTTLQTDVIAPPVVF